VDLADWLFGTIAAGFVTVLCLGALAGGLDLSTSRSRTHALVVALAIGGGFSALTGAWIGLAFPAAVLVLMVSGLGREPSARS
jgi:hypothetical protein